MALGPLMAHQPSSQFLKNQPMVTTVFSTHHHSSPSSSSATIAAVSLPQPSLPSPSSAFMLSDSDVAAAQHLLHLSSDADADDTSLNFGSQPDEATPIATCRIPTGGGDSNAAAPFQSRRKRRFASISDIYSRTKPLKTWKAGF